MKKLKKSLSLLITVCMLLTTVSLSFTAFAAASNAQWDALVTAMKDADVYTAGYKTNGNAVEFTGASMKLVDAIRAYNVVYKATRGAKKTDAIANPATTNQINDSIKNTLQSKMGSAWNSTCASFVTAFAGGKKITTGTTTGNTKRTTETSVVKVTLADEEIYAPYNTLSDLLSAGKIYQTVKFTYDNEDAAYSEKTTSCGSTTTTTYRFLYAADPVESQEGPVDLSAITKLGEDAETYTDYFSYTLSDFVALEQDVRTAAIADLGKDYKAVSLFAIEKYFKDYNFTYVVNGLNDANTIAEYVPLVNQMKGLYDTDYSAYALEDLQEFYETYHTLIGVFEKCSQQVKDYFSNDTYNETTLKAKDADIFNALQLAELRALKADTTDPAAAVYSQYDEDDYFAGDITKQDIVLAKGEINGYLAALDTYIYSNVLEVYGAQGLADLEAIVDNCDALIAIADADAAFADRYTYFTSTVYAAMDYNADTQEFFDGIKAYDGWYTSLKTFEAELVEEFGEATAAKIFTTLADEMQTKLDARYELLNARLAAEVDLAYGLLDTVKNIYGGEVTILSVATYGYLQDAIGCIEKDILNFLSASANYELSEELVAEYNELAVVVFDDYDLFYETAGFDRYEQTYMEDVVRKTGEDERIRNEDYTVDDALTEQIIDLIEKILRSDELKALGVDLASVLTPDLVNGIYTDSVINSIVQYVYPVVAKEFAKVWADLPTNVEADNPIGSGKLDVKLSLLDLTSAMKNIRFFIFPGLLADNIKNQYPGVAEVLKKATTKPVYHMDTDEMDNPWEDAAICDEEGKLALDWGVDAAADEDKEEAFLSAAQAALSGLEPLLLALISNKTLAGTHTDNDNDIAKDGKPGHGKVGTGSTSIKILISISVTVDPINLFLNISGNEGYNNAIVPILEALGLDPDKIPNGNNFTSTRQILKEGLIDPIKALIEQIAAAPVDFVLKALPNLAYAMETGRIVPLLSMLKTDINYHADAHYSAVAGLAAGDINEALSDGPISINIGEMIDLEELGLDLSDLNGLLGLLSGLLGEDVILPKINGPELATLGELTWKDTKRAEKAYNYGEDGKAAYIEANRADVLLFLFDYVINAIKADPAIIETIVNAVQASKIEEEAAAAAEAGEEYIAPEPFVLPDVVKEIINNVVNGYDAAENKFDALAALAELVEPKEYSTEASTLTYDSAVLDPDYAITDLHTGETIYTFANTTEYTEWWTEEKAQYVADNLVSFIDNIIMMFGVKIGDVKVESLSEVTEELVASLYTADTVNELAATLAGLFDGLEIEEELKAVLMDIIAKNIGDISVWDGYEADFEDGDKEAFKAALAEILDPVKVLLQFILTDKDITLALNDADGAFDVFTVPGHMGYTYGIIPLFEALGAEVPTTDEFAADDDNIVANLIDMLIALVDDITAEPYASVQNILPNLIYFIESDGIQVAIDNLLYPVDQLLEVISPIYPVSIDDLLDFDIRFAGIDPISFLAATAAEKIEEATGIEFEFDFTAAELLEGLTYGQMETYTSATGATAYRVAPGTLNADTVTQILRFLMSQTVFSENTGKLAQWARAEYELPDAVYYPLYAFLFGLWDMQNTHIDYALGILYYAFYGANTAVDAVADYYKYMRYDWQKIAAELADEDMTDLDKARYIFEEVYNTTGMTILDSLYEQGTVPINSSIINQFIQLAKRLFEMIKVFFKGISAKAA